MFTVDPELIRRISAEAVRFGTDAVEGTVPLLLAGAGIKIPFVHARDIKLSENGFWLTISSPEKVSEESNLTFWKNCRQLIHPTWKRILLGQPYLIWEMRLSHRRPELAIWAPNVISKKTLSNAIEAAWPGCKVAEGEDFTQSGVVVTARLHPIQRHLHSIHQPDAYEYLRNLIGAGNRLSDKESVAISVIARPHHRPIHRKRQANPKPGYMEEKSALVPIPAYDINIALRVMSTDTRHAKERMTGIILAFGSFEGANALKRYKSKVHPRRFDGQHLVSVNELAGLAPMPPSPVMRTGRPWEVVAGPDIPSEGKIIGDSGNRPVALTVEQASRHIHVTGTTGSGKTEFLSNLILQDIEEKRSVVVIDPAKGDIIDRVLDRLPTGAEDRLCLIDPLNSTHSVGLDVLTHTMMDLSVEHIISFLTSIWAGTLGVQQESLLRHTCMCLSYVPGATLMEIPTLLTHESWRKTVLDELDVPESPAVENMIKAELMKYDALKETDQRKVAGPLTSKLRSFLIKSSIRYVLGQSHIDADPFKTLEHGGIILARIPKGQVGKIQAPLLSALITAKVWEQVMSRPGPEEARYPTAYYADEVEDFLGEFHNIDEMLAQARGWGMSLVLAHQFFEQLPEKVRPAVSANTNTKITFRISQEDSHAAAKTFAPMTEWEIAHIPRFTAVCLPPDAITPFSFQTRKLDPVVEGRASQITKLAMGNWGRKKEDIDAEIVARMQNPVRYLTRDAKV